MLSEYRLLVTGWEPVWLSLTTPKLDVRTKVRKLVSNSNPADLGPIVTEVVTGDRV